MLGAPMLIGLGPRGARGGGGLDFTYKTATGDADPGAGCIRLNNATHASATEIYVDDIDAAGADAQALVSTWTSTSTIKGELRLQHRDTSVIFRTYALTGQTDAAGYTKLAVTYVTGAGVLAADDPVTLSCSRVGAKGDAGVDGAGYTPTLDVTLGSPATSYDIPIIQPTYVTRVHVEGTNPVVTAYSTYTLALLDGGGVSLGTVRCTRIFDNGAAAFSDGMAAGWFATAFGSGGDFAADFELFLRRRTGHIRFGRSEAWSYNSGTPLSSVSSLHRLWLPDSASTPATVRITCSDTGGFDAGTRIVRWEYPMEAV